MGFDKLSAPLAGVPVLRRTVDAFLAVESVRAIIVVCPDDRWEMLGGGAHFSKPVLHTDGGTDRQDSVARGLALLPDFTELVAVHDGARPLVHPDDIVRCIEAASAHQAASLARRVTETVKRSDAEGFCTEPVSRENLWFMETPQIFASALLTHAYNKISADKLTVTDEVSAVQAVGAKVRFVESSHPNLKITTPADLALAEALLK